MRTPVALKNLSHGGPRTLLSIAGISIAVLLIFMQLGFLGAVRATAVVIYNQLDFDLLLRSPEYFHLSDCRSFSRDLINEVASMDAVQSVEPVHVMQARWFNPRKDLFRGVMVIGIRSGHAFADEEVRRKAALLLAADQLLIDRKSSAAFGPTNGRRFGDQDTGEVIEINGSRAVISGNFAIGSGLAADGAAIVNEQGVLRIRPDYTSDQVCLGLIKLDSGVDVQQTRRQLEAHFAARSDSAAAPQNNPAVVVMDRAQVLGEEQSYWTWGTPVGFIFVTGVGVALFVGAVIVYIVLSSDVAKHIGEYATLKAMGYRQSYLRTIVMQQAVVLAVGSYITGLAGALILYPITQALANLPIAMTWERAAFVFAATLVMCCVSGVAALRRLQVADPADLF